jgi:putative hemolysin
MPEARHRTEELMPTDSHEFQAAGPAARAFTSPTPPTLQLEQGKYRVRFAAGEEDLDAALRLRFEVFNLEMGEGLAASHATGRDRDPFDAGCHHLIVEDRSSGQVVGTYRMQTQEMAAACRGFYTAGEFDLNSLPPAMVSASVEVGRAAIHRSYRNRQVLFLLWKGLAGYMTHFSKRYLFGCCSLTTQDPADGLRMQRYLTDNGHLHPEIRLQPLPGLECAGDADLAYDPSAISVPILFRNYLRYGARICGPPAIDREFKTIDFFVVLDIRCLDPGLYRLFF